jgi:spermidine/putrescine transport system substrate-binding protein
MQTNRRQLLGAGIAGVGFSLTGCQPAGGEAQKLNLFNYDTYIGATTLKDFRAATGITVNMSLFASGDDMFAKLKAGATGYDVIVPNHVMVTPLIKAGLIRSLDHKKIPNLANIDPAYGDPPYDPRCKYTIPYTQGVVGIAYRKSKMPNGMVPDSSKYLFDSGLFKGRIAISDDRFTLMEAAKYLGYSLENMTPEVLAKVEALLTRQIKSGAIKTFHQDNGQDLLLSGEVDIVNESNGDIAQVMTEDPDIGFVIPKEGDTRFAGTMAITADTTRPENAHKLLNYILDAKAGAEIARTIMYATPNMAARALMPESYRDNPVIFPPADIMARCEYAPYPDPATAQALEDTLTRLRAVAG